MKLSISISIYGFINIWKNQTLLNTNKSLLKLENSWMFYTMEFGCVVG